MKLLLSLLVAQVVWMAPGYADDITPSTVASLVMQTHIGTVLEETSSETPTTSTTQAPPETPKPKMYRMHVTSHIEYRFANTLISSRVGNPANVSQEVYFTVTLPETAFISKFLMEVDGKVYEATVKEKEEAKEVYDAAVASGQGAAHVALSARDSNQFTVSVNVEPAKKVNFNLTYEELLTRRLGAYNHVINLDPGQLVSDLRVDVFIKENKNITVLRVPELRSGNEVDANEATAANPLAKIERKSAHEAHVSFSPTEEEQKALGRVKGLDKQESSGYFGWHRPTPAPKVVEGLGGQFVVQYDVDHSGKAGEVLVNNGYFVHFFAPEELEPLPKHALFVLDVSGSMDGRKIEQLKEAMNAILDDLNEADYFNIIEFSYSVTVWNLDETSSSAVFSPYNSYTYDDSPKPNNAPTPAFPATKEYIAKAKEIVTKMRAGGGTNIYDTLKTVIQVAHDGMENITDPLQEKRKPIIVFLTDGEPTVGETRLNKIFSVVQELNINPQAALFSLAFGDDADLDFLKKLSLKNTGFARKIYEASDAALQLRDFYRQISSPLLANVTFDYQPDKVETSATTRTHFHTLFSGSEIIVAGRVKDKDQDVPITGHISGISYTGDSIYEIAHPYPIIRDQPHPVTSLERLWAYLTIQQLLEKQDAKEAEDEATMLVDPNGAANETETKPQVSPKKEALKLALQYSFVTPLTSLVVVKPNSTKETGTTKPAGSDSAYAPIAGHKSGVSASSSSFKNRRPVPMSGRVPYRAHLMRTGPVRMVLNSPQSITDRFDSSGYPQALGLPAGPASSYPGAPGLPGQAGAPGGSFASFGSPGQSGFPGRPSHQGGHAHSGINYAPSRPGSAGQAGFGGGSFQASGMPGYSGFPGRPSLQGGPTLSGAPFAPSSPGTAGPAGFGGGSFASSGAPGHSEEHMDVDFAPQPGSGPPPPPAPRPISATYRPPAPFTTTRPRTTTFRPAPVLISLEELEWLEEVTNSSDTITLPFDHLEGNRTFQLERNNQTSVELEDCRTLHGEEGQCRHLSQCSLNVFRFDIQLYREYFCHIGNFAGACCPKSLFPEESSPQAVSAETTPASTTTTTTTTE